jgi:transporter family-2 protein
MGPQKSRELYRLGAGGSNQLGFAQKGDEMAQIAVVLTLSVAAVFAGVSFVMQQAVNADLRSTLGSAGWAGFVSYLGGTLCMVVLALAMRDPLPAANLAVRANSLR